MSISQAVILLSVLGGIRIKAESQVYMEDILFKYVSPEYFDAENCEINLVETSDYEVLISSNLTVIKTMPLESEVHLELLGRSQKQYNLPTGLDFIVDFCDMLADGNLLGQFGEVLGVTRENCPPKPGIYSREDIHPTLDGFTDNFPENKYLSILEFLFEGKPLLVIHSILDVQG